MTPEREEFIRWTWDRNKHLWPVGHLAFVVEDLDPRETVAPERFYSEDVLPPETLTFHLGWDTIEGHVFRYVECEGVVVADDKTAGPWSK